MRVGPLLLEAWGGGWASITGGLGGGWVSIT